MSKSLRAKFGIGNLVDIVSISRDIEPYSIGVILEIDGGPYDVPEDIMYFVLVGDFTCWLWEHEMRLISEER